MVIALALSYSAVSEVIESVKIVTQLGQTFTAGTAASDIEKTYYFTSQYQLSGLGSFSDRSSSKLGALGVIVVDTTCAGWTKPSS